jgi:sugar lactone lactonase YvrE
MKAFFIYLITLLFIYNLSAQEFNVPESATFDSQSNRYFISNYGDGNIIQIDSLGEKSFFQKGLSKTLGMVIKNGVLYVVTNLKMVKGFSLSNSNLTFELQIDEAVFLNDLTCDNTGYLYVTDSNAKAVYKIDISNKTYSLFVNTKLDNPNGIVYDKTNNRLVLCYFREKAPVDEISLVDSVLSTIITTEFDNLDGITIDELGNFYISSWGAGSFSTGFKKEGTIYKFDNQFKKKPVKVSNGYHGPADIYYTKEKHELIVPLFLENNVKYQTLR